MEAKEIVERIMTQHWDMAACDCWICKEGRKAGCAPRDEYLPHKSNIKCGGVTVTDEQLWGEPNKSANDGPGKMSQEEIDDLILEQTLEEQQE